MRGYGAGDCSALSGCAPLRALSSASAKLKEHSYVETVCYILMGLSVLVVFKQLFAVAPVSCYWIIAEGVCYIGGAALYSIRSVRYMHSAFHFFVLAGSGCHLVAVWYILAGI